MAQMHGTKGQDTANGKINNQMHHPWLCSYLWTCARRDASLWWPCMTLMLMIGVNRLRICIEPIFFCVPSLKRVTFKGGNRYPRSTSINLCRLLPAGCYPKQRASLKPSIQLANHCFEVGLYTCHPQTATEEDPCTSSKSTEHSTITTMPQRYPRRNIKT